MICLHWQFKDHSEPDSRGHAQLTSSSPNSLHSDQNRFSKTAQDIGRDTQFARPHKPHKPDDRNTAPSSTLLPVSSHESNRVSHTAASSPADSTETAPPFDACERFRKTEGTTRGVVWFLRSPKRPRREPFVKAFQWLPTAEPTTGLDLSLSIS